VRIGRRGLVVLALLGLVGVAALGVTYGDHILRIATERPWHGGSFGANLATMTRVFAKYAQLVVWPATLSADYSYDAFPVSTTLLDPRALASLMLLAGLAAVAWVRWRRGGMGGLGLAWVAVALLPVSHLVPFRELLAEHYLYLPMVGIALGVAGIVDEAFRRWPGRRAWIAAGGCVIVAVLMARTVVRNEDWQDRLTLWSATVSAVPRCARAQFNLGQAYFEQSRLADAERAWLVAEAIQPEDRAIKRGLATLDRRLGRHDLAAEKIDALLAADPQDTETLVLAGGLALDRGRPERAREYFDAALALLPPDRTAAAQAGREQAVRAGQRPAPPGFGHRVGGR
jgi:tetratricopeptide (TPR) repeat protein